MKKKLEKIKKDSLNKIKKKATEDSFFKESHFIYIVLGIAIFVAIIVIYSLTHIKTDQISRPLKYNYLFGITETGSWAESFLFPLLLLIVVGSNLFLAHYFYKKDKFLTYVFLLINFFLCAVVFLEQFALNARGM